MLDRKRCDEAPLSPDETTPGPAEGTFTLSRHYEDVGRTNAAVEQSARLSGSPEITAPPFAPHAPAKLGRASATMFLHWRD